MLPPGRSNAFEWQEHMLVILLLDVGTEFYEILCHFLSSWASPHPITLVPWINGNHEEARDESHSP